MMPFDDALIHANFSFMYFLQFYLLIFLTFFNGGFNPSSPPLATPLDTVNGYAAESATQGERALPLPLSWYSFRFQLRVGS